MENASQYRRNTFYRNFDILIIFCCLSEVFQTDCGAAGILCIYFFYSIYKKRGSSAELPIKAGLIGTLPAALPLLTYVSPFPVQIFALADSLLLHCYNGEKGRGSKYFFYLFYPLHLLILSIIFWFYWRKRRLKGRKYCLFVTFVAACWMWAHRSDHSTRHD